MRLQKQEWLLFATGLLLCLIAAVLAVIDALIPRTGEPTLNITLIAGLFVMGLILSVRGLLVMIRNKKDR